MGVTVSWFKEHIASGIELFIGIKIFIVLKITDYNLKHVSRQYSSFHFILKNINRLLFNSISKGEYNVKFNLITTCWIIRHRWCGIVVGSIASHHRFDRILAMAWMCVCLFLFQHCHQTKYGSPATYVRAVENGTWSITGWKGTILFTSVAESTVQTRH